jgi:P4 family phage/plasmid primase-like protien
MTSSSQYKDLPEFLAKHSLKKESNVDSTHTRIPSKELNVFGGSYSIPKDQLKTFWNLYYKYIFVSKKKEYLTEKQIENGPILVDFDFRYDYSITTRQHTKEHLQDMVVLYLEKLQEIFKFEPGVEFNIYIMEKQNVNRLEDKMLTKDGIHMIIGISMDHTMQMILRDKIMESIADVWDMPITNSWDSVLDETISRGTTNWQMFGSRKPGHDAYELTRHWAIHYDANDDEFKMEEKDEKVFDFKNDFHLLSAQYDEHPKFELSEEIKDEYNKRLNTKSKSKKPSSRSKVVLITDDDDDEDISLDKITDEDMLQKAVKRIMDNLGPNEYHIKETHEYTQILPAKYYEPGSHLSNRLVAFALKDTDDRLFLSWIMLRSKASDFDYSEIPGKWQEWKRNFNKSGKDGVTRRSILFWAKQESPEEFQKIRNNSLDFFLDETLTNATDWDYAMMLYEMLKDRYACSSITNKTWYMFKGHRWVIDKGETLRSIISRDMYNLYQSKMQNIRREQEKFAHDDPRHEDVRRVLKTIADVSVKLKNTATKNNIIREAMVLFYDKHFLEKMDANKYLMCFKNGVVDFKNKEFRSGYPQDYITKCTNIDYEEYNPSFHEETSKQLLLFMEQLFPIKSLNEYMWNHLASCLIGGNKNQTFNVYRGSGSNGKSILTTLMSLAFGEYKATVPVTLVTEKRNGIGGTSSEVMQLKGVRYAVMQEPTKDQGRLNEGVMKELTGGDPIQARALYCEMETFIPQFKLVVCTNTMFEVNSTEDGTWRRFRICDFVSKFKDPDEIVQDTTKYVFPKDKDLDEKLPSWVGVFMSMLVKLAYENQGNVKDCDEVLVASNKYRQGQDLVAAFISENIEKTGNKDDKIKKKEVCRVFTEWCNSAHHGRKAPKGAELCDYLDLKYGANVKCVWSGLRIIYDRDVTDESNPNNHDE